MPSVITRIKHARNGLLVMRVRWEDKARLKHLYHITLNLESKRPLCDVMAKKLSGLHSYYIYSSMDAYLADAGNKNSKVGAPLRSP